MLCGLTLESAIPAAAAILVDGDSDETVVVCAPVLDKNIAAVAAGSVVKDEGKTGSFCSESPVSRSARVANAFITSPASDSEPRLDVLLALLVEKTSVIWPPISGVAAAALAAVCAPQLADPARLSALELLPRDLPNPYIGAANKSL
jgi:hypothetical protein